MLSSQLNESQINHSVPSNFSIHFPGSTSPPSSDLPLGYSGTPATRGSTGCVGSGQHGIQPNGYNEITWDGNTLELPDSWDDLSDDQQAISAELGHTKAIYIRIKKTNISQSYTIIMCATNKVGVRPHAQPTHTHNQLIFNLPRCCSKVGACIG